jgi:aminopeptidase N
MVEGLTNYLSLLQIERAFGREAAARQLTRQIAGPYARALATSGDGVTNTPAGTATGGPGSGVLLYGKAALGFMAIHRAIGDEAFHEAIARYAADFAFANSDPSDLRAAFEAAAGFSLAELWNFWFEQAATTVEDVVELGAWFAARP